MTFAVSCHECDLVTWPPADAEGAGGQSEIAALRMALDHARDTGHTEVYTIPGCYYVGDGERPTGFAEGVSVDDCTTPTHAKVVNDVAFAARTLRSEADRLDRWPDDTLPDSVADRLRERADLIERKQREREANP